MLLKYYSTLLHATETSFKIWALLTWYNMIFLCVLLKYYSTLLHATETSYVMERLEHPVCLCLISTRAPRDMIFWSPFRHWTFSLAPSPLYLIKYVAGARLEISACVEIPIYMRLIKLASQQESCQFWCRLIADNDKRREREIFFIKILKCI